MEFIWQKIIECVFKSYEDTSELDATQLHNLNVSLGHFCTTYRTKHNKRVTPSTMLGYLDGINRFLNDVGIQIDIRRSPVFNHKQDGFMTALDNIVKEQQSQGEHRKPHNVILENELEMMLLDKSTDPSKPKGYVSRLIIIIGLLTGLRPTALRLLKWSNFTHCLDHEGNQAIRYVGSVGGVDGDCKNQKGGVASAKDIPTHFLIFNEMLAFGINPYIIICEHKAQCELVDGGKDEDDFFLAANQIVNAKTLLKKSPLGKNTFTSYFNDVVKSANIEGVGFKKRPTLHSLRSTLISKLQRAGHTESQICQRTGHKSIASLQSYTTTLGLEGQRQQKHLFSQPSSSKKMKVEETNKSIPSTDSSLNSFSAVTANTFIINNYYTGGSVDKKDS